MCLQNAFFLSLDMIFVKTLLRSQYLRLKFCAKKHIFFVTLANIQQKCAHILQKDIKPMRTTCCLTMYCICRDLSVFHQRSLHLRVQLKLNFGGGDNETVHLGNKRLAGAISWREVCCEIAKTFFLHFHFSKGDNWQWSAPSLQNLKIRAVSLLQNTNGSVPDYTYLGYWVIHERTDKTEI